MNPPDDIKLVGALTEREFLSLISTDNGPTREQQAIIANISAQAKKDIEYDKLMAKSLNDRNVMLLTYLFNKTPKEPVPFAREHLRDIVAIFEQIFNDKNELWRVRAILDLLKSRLAMKEDEFELIDPKRVNQYPPGVDEDATGLKAEPAKYSFLSAQNIFNTAKGAATTYFAQNWGKPDPDLYNFFLKNSQKIDPDYHNVVEHLLQPGRLLDGFDVKTVMKLFDDRYNRNKNPRKFEFLKGAFDTSSSVITGRNPSKFIQEKMREYKAFNQRPPRFLFLPFPYPNHIVMVAIDFEKQQVMHYDSQGKSSSHRNDYANFSMAKDLEKIKQICFPENPAATIVDSSSIHQTDSHSCGVYILNFVESLLSGESFENLQKRHVPQNEIDSVRHSYARRVMTSFPRVDPESTKKVLSQKYNVKVSLPLADFLVFNSRAHSRAKPSELIEARLSELPRDKPRFLFLSYPSRRNNVMIAVDFHRKRVMFYDPKGIPSKPSAEQPSEFEFNMHAELEKIKQKCFPGDKTAVIKESPGIHPGHTEDYQALMFNLADGLLQGKTFEETINREPDPEVIKRTFAAETLALFPDYFTLS